MNPLDHTSIAMARCIFALLLTGTTHVACVAPPDPAHRPVGAIHATEDEPTYLHLDSVDPAIVASIKIGIEAGRAKFGTYGPLRVYVMNGRDDNRELVEDFCAHSRRLGDDRTIDEQVASFELPEDEGQIYSSIHHHSVTPFGAIVFVNPEHDVTAAAVHEYVHVFQAAFQEPGGPDPADPQQQIPGPAWLIEGAATYQAIASAGAPAWVAMAHEQCEASLRAAAEQHDVFLNDGVTYDALGDPALVHAVLYEGGAAAVKWLIDTHSDDTFWDTYYGAIPELGWEAAFEQTFGLTIDAFYDAFRNHLEA